MKQANEKILKRIRNLLAMAKDSSSPNEAAIAAGRARKLMDEYQVSEMDLSSTSGEEFGRDHFATAYERANIPLGYLSLAVAKLNDCRVMYTRGADNRLRFSFDGFLVDAVTCVAMMEYLAEEMNRQSEIAVPKGTPRIAKCRHAFKLGFGSGVRDQVELIMRQREQIKTSTGTSLIVVKDQLVTQKFGMQKTSSRGSSRANRQKREAWEYHSKGREVGRNTNLDRQVKQDRTRLR